MSTTQKHRDFVREPMGRSKRVDALPGIGDAAKSKLQAAGFTHAYHVFGQFLVSNMDEEAFKEWLAQTTGLTSNHLDATYKGLKEYADNHFA